MTGMALALARSVDPLMPLCTDDSSQSQFETEAELPTVFNILDIGKSYEYVIPSFCCISMTLQHVSVQFVDLDKIARMDAFFRTNSDLPGFSRPLPAKAKVVSGCLVPDKEFSQCIVTENLKLWFEGDIFVAYEWEWIESDDAVLQDDPGTPGNKLNIDVQSADQPEDDAVVIPDSDPVVLCVTFKCIGATKSDDQQAILQSAWELMQDEKKVPVKLDPEPNNPYDAKAIAFVCFIDGKWQRIGYVVREVLDDVHRAMRDGDIVKVEFAWIKFLLSFPRSGIGYYAGINITKHGEWSPAVIASASKIM